MSPPSRPGPLHALFLFFSALWTGALGFFALSAGIVLRTSPTREGGGIVNRALLDALDVGSLVVAGALLVLLSLLSRGGGWRGPSRALALRLLALGAVAAFVSLYLITPEMVALRSKVGPLFESLSVSDPLRRAWGRLHALSSLTLVVRIASGAAAFVLGLRAGTTEPPAAPLRDTA